MINPIAPPPWTPVYRKERDQFGTDLEWRKYLDTRPPIIGIRAADGTMVAQAHDLFIFTPEHAALMAAAPKLKLVMRLMENWFSKAAGGLSPWEAMSYREMKGYASDALAYSEPR